MYLNARYQVVVWFMFIWVCYNLWWWLCFVS